MPDVVVVLASAVGRTKNLVAPADVALVVEVISPGSRDRDLGVKRKEYAAAGIPDYWIVDREARTLTVLSLADGRSEYAETAEVKAGETFRATRPFFVEIDPAGVC